MPSFFSWLGGDPNVLINYFLGLIIIVLYAKDKFNTPTYDKESMGSFSQLPPQLLTIDARYRHGLRIYILLLITLYTALCIIGPSTFSNQNIQLGFAASTTQLWPVASATFLISIGAAKDSSILGKVEHFIRQYAQKTAYIPSIVSKLAYAIRNADTTPWLAENTDKLKSDDFEDRKAALTTLIGANFVGRINDNPRQQGHLGAWVRANIVFYCMQQMFRGVLPSEKLSQIIDVPENVAVFERLKKQREELKRRVVNAEEQRTGQSGPGAEVDTDKLLSDIQRFSKEVSLTIVVLLSQAVRTFSELRGRLEQLGFREIELRDNSDHLVYIVMVSFCVLLGAFIAYVVMLALSSLGSSSAFENIPYIFGWMRKLGELFSTVKMLNDFSIVDRRGEILTLASGSLIYMIVFKVIDYLREGYLDVSEWQENLQGYVTVVLMASACSAIIAILLMVLLLTPLNLLVHMWEDPAGLANQLLMQFAIAGLAAGFAVIYLRDAVKLKWETDEERKDKNEKRRMRRIILQEFIYIRRWADLRKVVHGVLAALLLGVLTHGIVIIKKNNRVEQAQANIDKLLMSFDQSEGWLGQRFKAAKRDPALSKKAGDSSLQLEELINITCKLRAMHAAINVFDAGEKELQLDPDLFNVGNDAVSSVPRQSATVAKCGSLSARNATIASQIEELKAICANLNRMGMPRSEKAMSSNAGGPPSATQRGSQRIVVPTLFLAPERCELNKFNTNDPDEQDFRGLGKSLSDLLFTLNELDKFSRDAGLAAVVFPMISAFFIAYMFGAGCHVWRGWWLNNEAGQQEVQKLKEQIQRIYKKPVNGSRYEEWLATPLNVINGVAPREAVRYEGLKALLYTKIENEQLDLAGILADG
jgi:hypothetical protein